MSTSNRRPTEAVIPLVMISVSVVGLILVEQTEASSALRYANSVRAAMGWKPLPQSMAPYVDMADVTTFYYPPFVFVKVFEFPLLNGPSPPRLPRGISEERAVRDLARFVSRTMVYDIGAEPMEYTPSVLERKVKQAEREGEWFGACGTAAYMFSYFCRKYGIPTRFLLILPSGEKPERTSGGAELLILHAQVQVWIDGRWVTVDPTLGKVGDSAAPVEGWAYQHGYVITVPPPTTWTVETQWFPFWELTEPLAHALALFLAVRSAF